MENENKNFFSLPATTKANFKAMKIVCWKSQKKRSVINMTKKGEREMLKIITLLSLGD